MKKLISLLSGLCIAINLFCFGGKHDLSSANSLNAIVVLAGSKPQLEINATVARTPGATALNIELDNTTP